MFIGRIYLKQKAPVVKRRAKSMLCAGLSGRFYGFAGFNAFGADISRLRFAFQNHFLLVQIWFESPFSLHVGVGNGIPRR
jgi:hypothetical protein